MDVRYYTKYSSSSVRTFMLMNGVPLSDKIIFGIPNLQMMFSSINLATATFVALVRGTASTHFMKISVAAKIHLCVRKERKIGPTRSIAHVWKGYGT